MLNKKIFSLFLIFSFILTSGASCKLVGGDVEERMQPVTLTYWRVWDDRDAFDDIIAKYRELHPFVNIEYKKFRYSEYEEALLEALAEDRGPDIFSIHNTWVREYQNKIKPMPPSITMVYPITKGTIKKETIPELRTTPSITLREIKDQFVDVVYDDVVVDIWNDEEDKMEQKVLALPLSVDTLAMYYNKDILNNAGIVLPPQYWNQDFQQAVKDMTLQNSQGEIIRSGVALGGSVNIERYSDILSVLMMQNGAEMLSDRGRVMFNQVPTSFRSQGYNPGLEALRFYTDFSNPAKEVYCWNEDMPSSLEAFTQGNLGIMFGYSYHLPAIKGQAPKLNFDIAPLPQIENSSNKIDFANYWVETVSQKSENSDTAWDFIQFAAKEEQVKTYLDKTNKPTALKALVNDQIDDLEVGVFAEQTITAKSWYKGEDAEAMEEIFAEMIDAANQRIEGPLIEKLNQAAQKVQQTID